MPQFPAPKEGIAITHFIVSRDVDRSRRFYTDVLGGEAVLEGELSIVALANGWVTISTGGGPTEDKPTVTLVPPSDPNQASSICASQKQHGEIKRLTSKPLSDLVSDLMWSKIGAENDAYLVINGKGFPVAHAGMVLTLRDLARFGLFFTPSGGADPGGGVPRGFLRRLLEPRRPALSAATIRHGLATRATSGTSSASTVRLQKAAGPNNFSSSTAKKTSSSLTSVPTRITSGPQHRCPLLRSSLAISEREGRSNRGTRRVNVPSGRCENLKDTLSAPPGFNKL
jgi:hypothetical protein